MESPGELREVEGGLDLVVSLRTFDVCHPQQFSFTYLGGDGRSPPWSPWSRSCGVPWRTERGGRWIGTMNDGHSERTNEGF